jgi:2-phospho-L-lactate transferase/gluconeogenesis factor (CofD/UPF0052 family)
MVAKRTRHFFCGFICVNLWLKKRGENMNRKTALKLVCIGGGTGLSTLLRGLKCYINDNRKSHLVSLEDLTAIVSVSDDGGSSGKLIDEFGVLPPGDIRNCLVALSDEAQVMTKLFEYRFDGNGSLAGHSVGNLLLCALAKLNNDSFPKAIQVASNVLAVKGKILPATLEGTLLCAELADGEVIRGESLIPKRGNREPIKRVYLEPRTNGHSDESIACAVASSHLETPLPKANMNFVCEALDEAVEAIKQADAVILGPGSLYTSIIPNLLVNGIAEALKRSNATKILVCNVMNEPGETDNYSISDYVRAITNHADFKLDYVLANNKLARKELLDQYIGEQLAEQFAGIMQYASEAIETLQVSPSKGDADFEKLSTISARIKALSNTIGPVKSANSVQVLFEAKRDHLENIKLHEEDMLCEDEIVERGTRKTVLRHRPEKLAQALINLLTVS